jgi:hypothetical protein
MRKLFVAALLLSSTSLLAQNKKLTLDDILGGAGAGFRGRGGESLVSPDGKYSLSQEHGQLTLTSNAGDPDKILASSAEPKSDFQWSRDNRHIAYVLRRCCLFRSL